MKNFFMIRHGQTTTNLEEIATGQIDVHLTPLGVSQAEKCRDVIDSVGFEPSVVIHSALIRTKETADIINQNLQCALHSEPGINEQYYGDWEGKAWKDILPEIEQRGENPPHGETQEQFVTRINKAIQSILERFSGSPLIVSHAGVFKALCLQYGCSLGKIENGVLYEFRFSESGNFPWEIYKYSSCVPVRINATNLQS